MRSKAPPPALIRAFEHTVAEQRKMFGYPAVSVIGTC